MTSPPAIPPQGNGRPVLLVTLPPFRGGVPAKAAILARHLRALGHPVTVAYYATLGDHPDLVVPSWRLLSARPGQRTSTCWDGFPCHAIGCRLPELEAPYTRSSAAWRSLVDAHDRHIAVGGTPAVANILVECGVPHLLWCAASMIDDRVAREEAMAWPRRLISRMLIRPALDRQQQRVFQSPLCSVMGVSRYTCRILAEAGAAEPRWLPIPTDLDRFSPPERPAAPGIIGFAARLGDPRKRVGLLLRAVAELSRRGLAVQLRLAGEVPDSLRSLARDLGLGDTVRFLGHVSDDALPEFYGGLDVFALPSSQEGLGIVGVEAMACGVPVVAAARGYGPDDYVVDQITGLFAEPRPDAQADALQAIIADRSRREAMSAAARALVVERYGHQGFAAGLEQAWRHRWGDTP